MKMTIDEAMSYIHGTYKFGSKLGLENIKHLLGLLGNPEKHLRFVHVAGTNGKGSTSSFISSVLSDSGYKTGLYTSPFIEVFNERMRIDGIYINDEELAEYTQSVKSVIETMIEEGHNHPTEFEVVTAIAMLYFYKNGCDIVVLEVGLGGRLDATNAIEKPLVSVITPLALDHVEYLGGTLDKIAYEKAGIIKPGGITVIHPQEPDAQKVIETVTKERNNDLIIAPLQRIANVNESIEGLSFDYEQFHFNLRMIASYQKNNAVVAVEVLKVLRDRYQFEITDQTMESGINHTFWMGRMEVLRKEPLTIIDGAHNLHGINGLVESFEKLFKNRKITAVIGILEDKEVDLMLEKVCPYLSKIVVTRPDNPRALSSEALKQRIQQLSDVEVIYTSDKIQSAVEYVEHNLKDHDVIVYFGSLYMIGQVRIELQKIL